MIKLENIVDQVEALPTLPGTAIKLMAVVNDPASTVDEIVEAIRYDQAVTGEILKLCNSAYFGLSRSVTSLNDAIVNLGTVKVLQLVMSVYTNSMLSREQGGYGLEPGVLWKHSVGVALAASLVSQRLKLPNANLAFTAGLLHDIGKVVLNEYVAKEFAEIVQRVSKEQKSFTEAETDVLGFSHDQVGALIAERWKLPESIISCIRHHHAPWILDPPDALVDTVYLANSICLLLGIGLGEDGLCSRADARVMERHGLAEADLELIGAQTMLDLRRVQELFTEVGATDSTSAQRQQVGAK